MAFLKHRTEFHITTRALKCMKDRELLETFIFVDTIAPLSSGFTIVAAEVGKRGYMPDSSEIKQRLAR